MILQLASLGQIPNPKFSRSRSFVQPLKLDFSNPKFLKLELAAERERLLTLEFFDLRRKYLKIGFENFYEMRGSKMFPVFEKESRLAELLKKKELLLLMMLKYNALLLIDTLYTHFFKQSKTEFEKKIVDKMVRIIRTLEQQ